MRLSLLLWLSLAVTQLGCSSGYTKIDGKWCYVIINEAVGREVRRIDADDSTFEVLADPEYARDKNHAYRYGRPLKDIDGSSYRLLSDSRWAVDRNGAYYQDHKIPGADTSSFEALGRTYGRDRSAVFCGTLRMDVEEPARFKETSVRGGMETTSYFYSHEDLAKSYGENFKDIPVTKDHPMVHNDGSGTDGVWDYVGPVRSGRVR